MKADYRIIRHLKYSEIKFMVSLTAVVKYSQCHFKDTNISFVFWNYKAHC